MGGNLASMAGPPEATLAAAALRLESLGRVTRRSSLYSTAPVGFAAQPRFMNAVVALATELGPRELLDGLLVIELEFGRERAAGIANGPRTLDLDILLLGELEVISRDWRFLIRGWRSAHLCWRRCARLRHRFLSRDAARQWGSCSRNCWKVRLSSPRR